MPHPNPPQYPDLPPAPRLVYICLPHLITGPGETPTISLLDTLPPQLVAKTRARERCMCRGPQTQCEQRLHPDNDSEVRTPVPPPSPKDA